MIKIKAENRHQSYKSYIGLVLREKRVYDKVAITQWSWIVNKSRFETSSILFYQSKNLELQRSFNSSINGLEVSRESNLMPKNLISSCRFKLSPYIFKSRLSSSLVDFVNIIIISVMLTSYSMVEFIKLGFGVNVEASS
ncbi:hypothetical protein BpHYR1_048551 [Brachionus plicatilis]|uniref:Uncharacterized protein n=1 Tax=Brachionus plicatilis TaxID=10195 RepID=A0A3M7SJD6_BRAPC|nr:hypothetical protein BpHYR1_048551 [Brachionus plicatilis]